MAEPLNNNVFLQLPLGCNNVLERSNNDFYTRTTLNEKPSNKKNMDFKPSSNIINGRSNTQRFGSGFRFTGSESDLHEKPDLDSDPNQIRTGSDKKISA